MSYSINLQTGQTGSRITVADRAAVDSILAQLKDADGFVSINPGAADRGATEAYVPVRAITGVIVARA